MTSARRDLNGGGGESQDRLDLSVVLPAYDEQDSIDELYDKIVAAVTPLVLDFEIIIVDDGSKDQTFARSAALAERDARIKVIKFRRNCGQTAAMAAGIEAAAGDVIVTMDADLQNDPADIPKLLAQIREGHDLVVGWRADRQDKWLSRRLPSMVANRLIAWVTGVDIKDNGCSLKAYRAALIKGIPLYAEMHRFIPAMCSIAGARIAQVKVRHHARPYGRSKYGLSRTYKVLADLIAIKTLLLFAARPLFWFVGSAAVVAVLAILCTVIAIYLASETTSVVVFMSVSTMLMALALFLVLIGLIGFLIYQTAPDGWKVPPLEASRAAAQPGSEASG